MQMHSGAGASDSSECVSAEHGEIRSVCKTWCDQVCYEMKLYMCGSTCFDVRGLACFVEDD